VLRGRATPVDIFEPRPDLDPSDLRHINEMMNRLSTNKDGALAELSAYATRHKDDAALANLLYRLEHSKAGGEYVLD
jgi:adenylate cyclase